MKPLQISIFSIFLFYSVTTFAQIPTDGLWAHYPLDGNAQDASGNNNHGTASAGLTQTTDRNGIENSAYAFDSKSADYLKVKQLNTSQISVSMWYQYAGAAGFWNNLIGHEDSQRHHLLVNHHNNTIGEYSTLNSLKDYVSKSGKWYHLVMIMNDKQWQLYVNDTLVGTKTLSWNNVTSPVNIIGNNYSTTSATQGSLGKIDEVYIYNRVLTNEEVHALYIDENTTTTECVIPSLKLKAHLPLNGNGNDISGNNFNGTPSGVEPTKDRIGVNNSAYYFPTNLNTPNIDIAPIGNDTISVSLWYKNKETNQWKTLLCGDLSFYHQLLLQNQQIGYYDGNFVGSGVSITDTLWHHIVMVKVNTNFTLYLDGNLIQNTTNAFKNSENPLSVIGNNKSGGAGSQAIKGSLDDVLIYTRILDQTDVDQLYCTSDVVTGIWSTESVDNKISIFPNPAVDKLTISGGLTELNIVKIVNAQGITERTYSSYGQNSEITISDLPAGIYIISVNDKFIGKFVKSSN